MGFDWGDENKLVWDRRIEELRKYKNCEVPCEENPILFDFVKLHATIYKLVMKKRGSDTNSRSFMHKVRFEKNVFPIQNIFFSMC